MKLRLIDRILIALSGLFLLALAAWMALDALSIVPSLAEALAGLLYVDAESPASMWVTIGVCAVLALLGVYDVCVLFRRRKGKRGFIAQRSENGEISISVKTIETLVIKCAQKHGEIAVQSVAVEEERSGLLIKLRAVLPSGMNIPLAVGTLQKQIKQYITACSGVDVSEVRVKVDSTDRTVENSAYAVSDETPALPVEQPEPAPIPAEAVVPVALPAEEPEAPSDEREQLMHQRLFSPEEELAMVPEPPVPEEPVVSEEEIRAEVEQEVADAAGRIEAEVEEAVADAEAHAAEWEAAAAEVEAHEAEWEAAAAEADMSEAGEPGEPEEETKETAEE